MVKRVVERVAVFSRAGVAANRVAEAALPNTVTQDNLCRFEWCSGIMYSWSSNVHNDQCNETKYSEYVSNLLVILGYL